MHVAERKPQYIYLADISIGSIRLEVEGALDDLISQIFLKDSRRIFPEISMDETREGRDLTEEERRLIRKKIGKLSSRLRNIFIWVNPMKF